MYREERANANTYLSLSLSLSLFPSVMRGDVVQALPPSQVSVRASSALYSSLSSCATKALGEIRTFSQFR